MIFSGCYSGSSQCSLKSIHWISFRQPLQIGNRSAQTNLVSLSSMVWANLRARNTQPLNGFDRRHSLARWKLDYSRTGSYAANNECTCLCFGACSRESTPFASNQFSHSPASSSNHLRKTNLVTETISLFPSLSLSLWIPWQSDVLISSSFCKFKISLSLIQIRNFRVDIWGRAAHFNLCLLLYLLDQTLWKRSTNRMNFSGKLFSKKIKPTSSIAVCAGE